MITPQMIKHLFLSAVHNVTAHIKDFSLHPGIDFSRTRKLPPDTLIRLLVAEGASSTRVEPIDFFGFDPDAPTSSAFRQQRARLRPDAIKEVLDTFNTSLTGLEPPARCAAPATAALPLMDPPSLSTALPASLPTVTSCPKAILRKAFTVFM